MLTNLDIDWLRTYHPKLIPSTDQSELKGELSFEGAYNQDLNKFQIIYPGNENTINGIILQGCYKLTIKERKENDPTGLKLPGLYLEDGQIAFTAERHFNLVDKSACICGSIEEDLYIEAGFQIDTFISFLIVPFLYEQLYYDTHNKEWPWGEYGHGSIGILESYSKTIDSRFLSSNIDRLKRDVAKWPYVKSLLLRKDYIKGHTNCLCGSGDIIRRCHPEAWHGINKLRNHVLELAVKI